MERSDEHWIPGTRVRILLIDSDPKILEILRTLLKQHGHEVFIATDAATALLLAQQFAPHVICAGVELEGTSGYELARQLRALPATSRSHLIALAELNGENDAIKRTESGFDDFLLKPADCGEILTMVNHVVNA